MNKKFATQSFVGGVAFLFIIAIFGAILSTRARPPAATTVVQSGLPRAAEPSPRPWEGQQPFASATANASHGAWKIIKNKNPITGAISMYAQTESTKKLYHPFVLDHFEKVSLVVGCPALDQPYLMLWANDIMTTGDAGVYQGPIRIDDQVVPVAWRVGGNDSDILIAITNGVVQKLQTGNSVIVSFNSLKAGE